MLWDNWGLGRKRIAQNPIETSKKAVTPAAVDMANPRSFCLSFELLKTRGTPREQQGPPRKDPGSPGVDLWFLVKSPALAYFGYPLRDHDFDNSPCRSRLQTPKPKPFRPCRLSSVPRLSMQMCHRTRKGYQDNRSGLQVGHK